ncbi:MAG: hypothetical protein HFG17_10415 [Oscillospiraceae bacterium]|nr:hypothetical protein [Oscillospiraceae bacterium]
MMLPPNSQLCHIFMYGPCQVMRNPAGLVINGKESFYFTGETPCNQFPFVIE